MVLRVGTRQSRLALAQSEWVKARIEENHPDLRVELIHVRTSGDRILDISLSEIGGKGLFVKEIEAELLRANVDLAVHSMKDIPAETPGGLRLVAFPEREDPRDAFLSTRYGSLDQLPEGARVGTSSLRRKVQVLCRRPDLELVPLRGNVDTRIRKMKSGEVDAVILAAAGLKRLGLVSQIREMLPVDQIIPAIGQGALGLEVRENDRDTVALLAFLNHRETEVTVRAERSFLKELQGGCQVPMGAFARLRGGELHLEAMVGEPDGTRILRDRIQGDEESPDGLGIELARRMLDAGAGEILARIAGTAYTEKG